MSANRREFIESLGLGAGSLAAMGALSGFTESARGYLANDTINIACIGTGGRCRHLMSRLGKTVQGVRVVAVCDVWDQHRAEGKKLADPQAFETKNFREVLARKDVDAVLIGAPDHWHVPMTVEACAAGKDVYVEKPLTHDPSEGQAVIDAQNNHKKIVQVGTQQRSMPHIQKAAEIIRSGQIGDVRKLHLTWNRNQPRGKKQSYGIAPESVDWKSFLGNAKEQPFDEYRFRNWRWFWDFGGGIFTDLMVHWIDVAHWILNLDKPTTAASIGDNFISEGLWETPDTVQTLLKYPAGLQAYFEGTFYNARHGSMIEFEGSEATLYIDRGRYEVHPERKKKIEYSELVLSKEPATRGADFYDLPDGESLHLANWLECIRSRNKPTAPAEAGVGSAFAAHLANQSLRSGQIAKS